MVIKGREAMMTVFISKMYLEYDYELCLWKDVDKLIGWSRRNIYRIRNSSDLKAGKLYWFHWLRDSHCLMSEDSP